MDFKTYVKSKQTTHTHTHTQGTKMVLRCLSCPSSPLRAVKEHISLRMVVTGNNYMLRLCNCSNCCLTTLGLTGSSAFSCISTTHKSASPQLRNLWVRDREILDQDCTAGTLTCVSVTPKPLLLTTLLKKCIVTMESSDMLGLVNAFHTYL